MARHCWSANASGRHAIFHQALRHRPTRLLRDLNQGSSAIGSSDDETPDITTGYQKFWPPPTLPPSHLISNLVRSAAFEAEPEAMKTQYYAHHTIVGCAMHTDTQRYSPEEIFMEFMRSR